MLLGAKLVRHFKYILSGFFPVNLFIKVFIIQDNFSFLRFSVLIDTTDKFDSCSRLKFFIYSKIIY